jgi:hypothetical protein
MRRISEDHKEIASGKKVDDEGYMARIELNNIKKSVDKLKRTIKSSDQQLPAWVQSKITRAADYIDSAAEYLSSDEELDENISFNIDKNRKPVPVGKNKLMKMSPEQRKQLPPEMVKKVLGNEPQLPNIKKEELSLTERILTEMGCDCDMKGNKSVNEIAKKHNTSVEKIESQLKKGINVEMEHTTDKYEAEKIALQHLEEKPDYYTRLTKVEKESEIKEAKKYMTKKEDPCWKGYEMVGFKKKRGKKVPNCVPVSEAVRIQSQSGQLMNIIINWRNRIIVTQLFFPQIRIPKRNEVLDAIEKVYPGAKLISFRVSNIDPKLPLVQVNEEGPSLSVNRGEKLSVEQGGGLTAKGRKKYNRATGSNLQAPVTGKVKRGSKAWKRRRNFCSRSRSWKRPRGLAARRRWKC